MRLNRREAIVAGLTAAGRASGAVGGSSSMTLWYAAPATKWTEALPVGNGHLGAMVFGEVVRERIQLNEHSLWSGRTRAEDDSPKSKEALPKVRELLFAGKYREANSLAQAEMMQPMNKETFGSYQM